jgi:WD40 repeat protein
MSIASHPIPWPRRLPLPLACAVLSLALLTAGARPVPAQEGKEQLAVLEFEVIGSTREQGAVLTNQLRAELLKTGRFTMVNRAQLDKILEELALQQQICTQKECAVEVGKLLGVRRIVTGTVTKVTDTLWQVSATMTNVETAEILRQEVINHAGDFASLFLSGMANVSAKLSASAEEVAAGALRLTPESIAPAVHDALRKVRVSRLAFSHDSARLYYAVGDTVQPWNLAERAAVGKPIAVPGGDISAMAVNRTGARLAVGTRRGSVSLIETATGKVLHTENAHSNPVTTLAFSPADNFFASGGEDEKVHVYDVRTGSDSFALDGPDDAIATVRFSADGKYLIAASLDRTVRLYDVNVQREVRTFKESAKRLLFAEISGDGAYLAVAAKEIHIDLRRNRRTDTELVKIRDVKTGEELLSFEAHEKDVRGLAFFPDTRYLATGGAEGLVKIWDLQKKASIANLNLNGRVTALGVSPNGKWLAAADDTDTLTIWEVTR